MENLPSNMKDLMVRVQKGERINEICPPIDYLGIIERNTQEDLRNGLSRVLQMLHKDDRLVLLGNFYLTSDYCLETGLFHCEKGSEEDFIAKMQDISEWSIKSIVYYIETYPIMQREYAHEILYNIAPKLLKEIENVNIERKREEKLTNKNKDNMNKPTIEPVLQNNTPTIQVNPHMEANPHNETKPHNEANPSVNIHNGETHYHNYQCRGCSPNEMGGEKQDLPTQRR